MAARPYSPENLTEYVQRYLRTAHDSVHTQALKAVMDQSAVKPIYQGKRITKTTPDHPYHSWFLPGLTGLRKDRLEIDLDNEDPSNYWMLAVGIGEYLGEVQGMADDIVNHEVRGINTHGSGHIKHTNEKARRIYELAKIHRNIPDLPSNVLALVIAIGYHDVAMGITGRKDHAQVGALFIPFTIVLRDSVNPTHATNTMIKAMNAVRRHEAAAWNYRLPDGPESLATAVLVLADETHFEAGRVTEAGDEKEKLRILEGRDDVDYWYDLNLCVEECEWEWSNELNRPVLRIKLLNKLDKFPRLSPTDIVNRFAKAFAETVMHPGSNRFNLWRSAVKKIFGSPQFEIEVTQDGHVVELFMQQPEPLTLRPTSKLTTLAVGK